MTEKKYHRFTTPIGRLVSGAPALFRTTNSQGEPLLYKSGVNIGQPKREYSIGVAFDKTQSDVPAFIREIKDFAKSEWPQYFDANSEPTLPAFSLKITDGDSTIPNKKGRRPCDTPEWAGCWVMWFSSDREPPCVLPGASSIIPATEIKTGYYVRVKGSTSKNTGDTPGMYMNLEGVERSGFGPEISSRPDPIEAFKEAPAAVVPQGMSQVPVATGEMRTPDDHKQEVYGGPVASENAAPPPPAGGAAPPPPASEAKVMYQGVAYTKQFLRDSKWTEDQINALPTA